MMHRCLVLTPPPLRGIAALEVHELIGVLAAQHPFGVLFEAEQSQIATVAFWSQSAFRVLIDPVLFMVGHDLPSALVGAKSALEDSLIGRLSAFKVSADRMGTHGFSSVEFAAALAPIISARYGIPASIRAADALVHVAIDGEQGVLGLDVAGMDLSKRYYKVFATPHAPKGPYAYALMRKAEPAKALLDPLCGSGMLVIEAAAWSLGISVRAYEKEKLWFASSPVFDAPPGVFAHRPARKLHVRAYDPFMPNVVAAKKNAKIANVQKAIGFGRGAIDWIDTKFEDAEVASLAAVVPRAQNLDELCYQLAYIMRPSAKAALATAADVAPHAAKHGLVVLSREPFGPLGDAWVLSRP